MEHNILEDRETELILATSTLAADALMPLTRLTTEAINTLAQRVMELTEVHDPIPTAARDALTNIEWDGSAQPVAGLVVALSDELAAAGYGYDSIATMLDNIAEFLRRLQPEEPFLH